MLRVYQRYLSVLRSLRPVIEGIERHDKELGRQLRRAACSVRVRPAFADGREPSDTSRRCFATTEASSLNLCEGSGSEGGTRRQRHLNALGSAREVSAALDSAEALGHVAPPRDVLAALGGVIGTLVVLVHGRR